MKIEEVVRRAQEDARYASKLRDLAYKARDEGMESRAYKSLAKELAETPSDLRALNSTLGYTTMLSLTTSKIHGYCLDLSPTIGGNLPSAPGAPATTGASGKPARTSTPRKAARKTT